MLEGGCGRGNYVAFYSGRGVEVVGLDFAREALGRLHQREKALPLCAGNVAALPFSDHSFDVYYSGGVVEHFEEGAARALSEARRVLRPGGTLLISVPYLSPLRWTVSLLKRSDRRTVTLCEPDGKQGQNGRVFFQYAYKTDEFKRLLEAEGFRVLSTRGYSILWGLCDLPFSDEALQWLNARRPGRERINSPTDNGAAPATSSQAAVPSPSLLKRLLIGEDDRVPALGWLVRAMRFVCANMMMYVCAREALPTRG
jgi:SAM-dependent methyltransferase